MTQGRRMVGGPTAARPPEGGQVHTAPPPRGETLVAREGDVLHVSYPEVTLPLKLKYASVRVGGISMTRTLREGEDVGEQFDRIYSFLSGVAEREGSATVKRWYKEFANVPSGLGEG